MAIALVRNFIAKQIMKKGKGITSVIPDAKEVTFAADHLEKRLIQHGVDLKSIKSEGQLKQILAYVKQAEDQAFAKRFKDVLEPKKADVFDLPTKKKERPFTGWTPKVVERSMPADDYAGLKEEWFSRIMTNTDEALNTWLKKGDWTKSDERFINLSKNQRKDFLDMVDYRLKHGNKKFMNDFTDAKGKFKLPEDLAYGGLAGMLGEPTYADGGRVPLSKGKAVKGLAALLEKFFPGTTKLGKRSKPFPEKVKDKRELREAIAGFQEREAAAKLKSYMKYMVVTLH